MARPDHAPRCRSRGFPPGRRTACATAFVPSSAPICAGVYVWNSAVADVIAVATEVGTEAPSRTFSRAAMYWCARL